MRLRTFIAADMAEAIDQVRRELGSDAIIVSSFVDDAGRVEVTAAIESRPQTAGSSHPASLPDIEASLEQMLRHRLRAAPLPRTDQAGAPTQPTAPAHSGIFFDETLIAAALDAQGVPPFLRDALVAAAATLDSDDALAALVHAIGAHFSFEPIPVHPQAPVMLVGLPGSGKTVTMAKLAANALIGGATVDLFTTDIARAGAAAQSEAYGKLLDVAVHPAASLDELSILLDERTEARGRRSAGVCLIDTTSVNPFDCSEFGALKRMTDGAHLAAGVESVLVLSAMGDAFMLADAAVKFADLGVRRLIVTQLDIARRLGPTLAAADRAGFALAQLSVTPYLARGLASMNPLVCARLILDTHDARADAAIPSAV